MELAAENTPTTRPRCRTNHRLATTAPNDSATDPVPTPIVKPHSSHSCHADSITRVRPEPTATSSSAVAATRRMPNRSIRAAANGATSPYMTRLRVTAPLVVVRDQPKSASSGSSSAPVVERNPAAATRAPIVASATHQARWMRGRRAVPGSCASVTAES